MLQARLPDISAHAHEAALLRWASLAVDTRPELEMIYAIPNDGYRTKATASRLKAEGVRSGISDLALVWPRGPLNGLYIERKTLTGSTSKTQKEWISKPKRYGYQAILCKGWDAARTVIEDYLDQLTANLVLQLQRGDGFTSQLNPTTKVLQ